MLGNAGVSFSILIGSSGGSSHFQKRSFRVHQMFQYPHRIVGGLKNGKTLGIRSETCVSVSSSDRRGVQVEKMFNKKFGEFEFQYPHRIVGGFKFACAGIFDTRLISFQYPHRIVGGFKSAEQAKHWRLGDVSVSSSDRRGVQEKPPHRGLFFFFLFQYPHRIVGGFKLACERSAAQP